MNTLDDLITVDLGYCEFKYWYRLFSKYSMKSHILELPFDISSNDSSSSSNINLHHEFGVYLKQDGIILPNDHLASQITDTDAFIHKETFEFISSHVSEAMKQFREKDDTSICYFMKTNWSCPSDAKWILTGQCLKCYNLEDMYTVLKASDRVLYDLELLRLRNEAVVASGGVPSPLTIVTRKWANFNPSMEFRCFVRGKELIGELMCLVCLLCLCGHVLTWLVVICFVWFVDFFDVCSDLPARVHYMLLIPSNSSRTTITTSCCPSRYRCACVHRARA